VSTFKMRSPCPHCESPFGRVETRGGQACVFCSACARWVYNAPRVETGQRQRSVSTVHVGHLISVEDGLREGLDDATLNHQENLAALCESCNLGLGDQSVPLRTLLRITALRLGVRRASA
jgi:hypothetical protein